MIENSSKNSNSILSKSKSNFSTLAANKHSSNSNSSIAKLYNLLSHSQISRICIILAASILFKGPITGNMHICADRDDAHKSFVIRRGKHEISKSDNFFKPIVIQTKDKVI